MLTVLAALAVSHPLILAHYMPWFQSKPVSGQWGWHWTMNRYNPDNGELASQFHPLIGPYDSSDPDALEYQTLEMKIAGIDGVLIDWYGVKDMYDYRSNNRNTDKMTVACSKAGLKYAVVMEDAIVPGLVKAGKSTADDYANSAITWLQSGWFQQPGYLQWHGKPLLLIFGPQYYKEPDLQRFFGETSLFTLLGRKDGAVGAFDWPEPQVGDEKSWKQVDLFYDRAKSWPSFIPVAYPRFEDIYKQAGIHDSYGEIKDQEGQTFQKLLDRAHRSGAPFVQIATWNDWGEGTQIEPSKEFGYRDLEVLQRDRRNDDPSFPYREDDLRLPADLYRLRKSGASKQKLDEAARNLLHGQAKKARSILKSLG